MTFGTGGFELELSFFLLFLYEKNIEIYIANPHPALKYQDKIFAPNRPALK